MKRNRVACCIFAWVFCILGLLGCGKEEPSFILGMDASCVPSLEAGGIQYYNREGQAQDVFEILADAGVNYIRVRVWNDPYDEAGQYFGGCAVENQAFFDSRGVALESITVFSEI